jgi:geranyl diphosphate 2-C-methyltransferase
MPHTQETLTVGVRNYYDGKKEDRNLRLSGKSGIINHHFGIGDFPRTKPLERFSQEEIAAILHDLEMKEIDVLIENMGGLGRSSTVLDAGCGRGGTAFTLASRYGAWVEGITISLYQKVFAENLLERAEFPASERVKFHLMDYLDLEFPNGTFEHVITNETTLYAMDLKPLFSGFHRVLKDQGHYTIATWCINERQNNPYINPINAHYRGMMHTVNEYMDALAAAGFRGVTVRDYTVPAIPYWELRQHWDERSGIEDAFYNGHLERKILYLFINARK